MWLGQPSTRLCLLQERGSEAYLAPLWFLARKNTGNSPTHVTQSPPFHSFIPQGQQPPFVSMCPDPKAVNSQASRSPLSAFHDTGTRCLKAPTAPFPRATQGSGVAPPGQRQSSSHTLKGSGQPPSPRSPPRVLRGPGAQQGGNTCPWFMGQWIRGQRPQQPKVGHQVCRLELPEWHHPGQGG